MLCWGASITHLPRLGVELDTLNLELTLRLASHDG